MSRTIGWFSCGNASAVACAIALQQHPDTIVARIVLPNEHHDNDRFAADCERWRGMSFQPGQHVKYFPITRGAEQRVVSAVVVRDGHGPDWIVIRKEGFPNPISVKRTSITPIPRASTDERAG